MSGDLYHRQSRQTEKNSKEPVRVALLNKYGMGVGMEDKMVRKKVSRTVRCRQGAMACRAQQ